MLLLLTTSLPLAFGKSSARPVRAAFFLRRYREEWSELNG